MAEIPASTLGVSGSLSLAGACSVFSVVPSPLPCGKCIPPLGFPAAHTPQATFPKLSTVWMPSRPCRARPGAGPEFLSSPIPPSLHLLPCLRGAGIRPAAECGTWGTGPSLTPSCFRWGVEVQRRWHVSRGHRPGPGESSWLFLVPVAPAAGSEPMSEGCPQVTFAISIISYYLLNT